MAKTFFFEKFDFNDWNAMCKNTRKGPFYANIQAVNRYVDILVKRKIIAVNLIWGKNAIPGVTVIKNFLAVKT